MTLIKKLKQPLIVLLPTFILIAVLLIWPLLAQIHSQMQGFGSNLVTYTGPNTELLQTFKGTNASLSAVGFIVINILGVPSSTKITVTILELEKKNKWRPLRTSYKRLSEVQSGSFVTFRFKPTPIKPQRTYAIKVESESIIALLASGHNVYRDGELITDKKVVKRDLVFKTFTSIPPQTLGSNFAKRASLPALLIVLILLSTTFSAGLIIVKITQFFNLAQKPSPTAKYYC